MMIMGMGIPMSQSSKDRMTLPSDVSKANALLGGWFLG